MVNAIRMLLPFIDWTVGPGEITSRFVRDADHKSLLSLHNGLTAFNGGLRIFGTKPGKLPTLQKWNDQNGWRSAYKELVKETLFFSQKMCSVTNSLLMMGASFILMSKTGGLRLLRIRFRNGCRSFLKIQWIHYS